MLAFLVYFFTAIGILYPAGLAWLDGKAPLTVTHFSSTFIGPPGLLMVATLFAVFTPRLAGCLAFAGVVSCWIYSGSNVVHAVISVSSMETLDVLKKMNWIPLVKYLLHWLPTFFLIFTTFYSLRKALKISPDGDMRTGSEDFKS